MINSLISKQTRRLKKKKNFRVTSLPRVFTSLSTELGDILSLLDKFLKKSQLARIYLKSSN